MGVAFIPTGIGVILTILISLNYLSSRLGRLILSSAVLDDIIGLLSRAFISAHSKRDNRTRLKTI